MTSTALSSATILTVRHLSKQDFSAPGGNTGFPPRPSFGVAGSGDVSAEHCCVTWTRPTSRKISRFSVRGQPASKSDVSGVYQASA